MKKSALILLLAFGLCGCGGNKLLLEAESLDAGGWVLDQQFMDSMGSPYLLAHGLGRPVEDATGTVLLPSKGLWHIYVRCYNWTSPWYGGEGPGAFKLLLNGKELPGTFGNTGNCWRWEYAGEYVSGSRDLSVSLRDLSGFDGRCDAILFTREKGDTIVPAPRWADRRVRNAGRYDLVVVGAGTAGICAAVSAAREGLKVALIHDRPLLGGNNSSEVRVHLGGRINCGPYPRLGNLVKEFGHSRKGNAKPAEYYEDWKKDSLIASEPGITLFRQYRMVEVDKKGDSISSLLAVNTVDGSVLRFKAALFADCSGDGNLGYLAGADYRTGREGASDSSEDGAPETADSQVMGASVQWYSLPSSSPQPFPVFEYGKVFGEDSVEKVRKGEWTWETGMNRDQIAEAELIRDHGLLVVYSNWSYLKNRFSGRGDFSRDSLSWVAYVAGKRESRRLLGDHILDRNDILDRVEYEDASFTTSWSIDLHYPDPANTAFFPGGEFKAVCVQEPIEPYAVPYRCLYSRNVDNLFMAGRDISVTHIALGTVRVMRTTAMMGEVVGMAASVCHRHSCSPRDVYSSHLDELKVLMERGSGRTDLPDNQNFNLGKKIHKKTW